MCKNLDIFEGKKITWKSHLQIGHSCTKPFKYWRLCAIRAYVSFWVDFHFLQDWAQPDFWQTDLFGHEKLCSVQVCLPKIISPTRNEKSAQKAIYTLFAWKPSIVMMWYLLFFWMDHICAFRSCSTYFLHMEQWWHLSGLIAWHISQYLAARKYSNFVIDWQLNQVYGSVTQNMFSRQP